MHFWFLPDTNELKLKCLDFTGTLYVTYTPKNCRFHR